MVLENFFPKEPKRTKHTWMQTSQGDKKKKKGTIKIIKYTHYVLILTRGSKCIKLCSKRCIRESNAASTT